MESTQGGGNPQRSLSSSLLSKLSLACSHLAPGGRRLVGMGGFRELAVGHGIFAERVGDEKLFSARGGGWLRGYGFRRAEGFCCFAEILLFRGGGELKGGFGWSLEKRFFTRSGRSRMSRKIGKNDAFIMWKKKCVCGTARFPDTPDPSESRWGNVWALGGPLDFYWGEG